MNLATLIIPAFDNDGSDNAPVIERAVARIVAAFGGATVTDAKGYWMAPDGRLDAEPVVKIEAAAKASADNAAALDALAADILAETDQEAVFVQGFDGEVTIKGR